MVHAGAQCGKNCSTKLSRPLCIGSHLCLRPGMQEAETCAAIMNHASRNGEYKICILLLPHWLQKQKNMFYSNAGVKVPRILGLEFLLHNDNEQLAELKADILKNEAGLTLRLSVQNPTPAEICISKDSLFRFYQFWYDLQFGIYGIPSNIVHSIFRIWMKKLPVFSKMNY